MLSRRPAERRRSLTDDFVTGFGIATEDIRTGNALARSGLVITRTNDLTRRRLPIAGGDLPEVLTLDFTAYSASSGTGWQLGQRGPQRNEYDRPEFAGARTFPTPTFFAPVCRVSTAVCPRRIEYPAPGMLPSTRDGRAGRTPPEPASRRPAE